MEARGLLYILGVRERTDKLVRELVLDDAAPLRAVGHRASAAGTSTTRPRRSRSAGARYIVCRNHQEAAKDAAERAAILAALERQLRRGDKALVGNNGYRRFLKTAGEGHFAIDRAKAEEDARFDGIFVLRTNTDLNPLAAMLRYKQLWTVERTFRTAKSLLATRPIFHKLDETIRGHVFCSFLALVLKKELEDRIAALGHTGSWPAILADLDSLTETEIEQDGKRFLLRSAPTPRREPRPARRRRRPAADRAGGRRALITLHQHVVPRRRASANCRAYSITCRKSLLKMGQTGSGRKPAGLHGDRLSIRGSRQPGGC